MKIIVWQIIISICFNRWQKLKSSNKHISRLQNLHLHTQTCNKLLRTLLSCKFNPVHIQATLNSKSSFSWTHFCSFLLIRLSNRTISECSAILHEIILRSHWSQFQLEYKKSSGLNFHMEVSHVSNIHSIDNPNNSHVCKTRNSKTDDKIGEFEELLLKLKSATCANSEGWKMLLRMCG